MTPRELLTDGRLTDAIVAQRASIEANPIDHAAKLFLFELLVVAGKYLDANSTLKSFESAVPDFHDYAQSLRRLLRAERRRQHGFKPTLLAEPPMHVRCRWHAVKAMRIPDEVKATKWADRAEAKTPVVRGHVNGREFEGLRDADERFASSFEFLAQGRYHWVPFEQVKKLTLGPAEGVLDTVLRPAELILKGSPLAPRAERRQPASGIALPVSRDVKPLPLAERADYSFRGHVPLVYPGTATPGRDDSFLLGHDADFMDVAGLVVGIGERVLTAGEEEIPLGEIRQLEFR